MKVVLLMGGRSGEHDISLMSGAAVAAALDSLGYPHLDVILERDGGASWPGGAGSTAEALVAITEWGPDVAFIAMHGADGEDGTVQGALQLIGVPYQGSGVQASANGLDKARTKALLRLAGLPVARDRVLQRGAPVDWDALADELGLPVVLKTEASGSSVGVEVIRDRASLAERGPALLDETPALLAEAYLAGREFTGPVLEDPDGVPRALPAVEIRPRTAAFFDYVAKYTPGATDELCPAPIPAELEAQLGALALAAHEALGCRGYSRTDLMLDAAGAPHILEVNTLPGLTQASLLPKSARVAGLDFPALVARLLHRANAPTR